MSEKIVLSYEQLIELGSLAGVLSIEQMADYFGIVRTTFHTILERQPEALVQYKKGRSKVIKNVGNGLIEKALNGDTASSIFYLKTQAGWKETSVQENINVEKNESEMTDKELEDIASNKK